MPKSYPIEFRMRAIALVRAGKSITDTAQELGLGRACLYLWVKQDRIDHGEAPGLTSKEQAELTSAKRRIRELEMEIEIIGQGIGDIYRAQSPPKRIFPVVDHLVGQGLKVKLCWTGFRCEQVWFGMNIAAGPFHPPHWDPSGSLD